MNYLAATHTLPKHNAYTGKWTIHIVLSHDGRLKEMEFASEKMATDFICARMKEVSREVWK